MNPMDWHIGAQIYFGGWAIAFLIMVGAVLRLEETEFDNAAGMCFMAPWIWPLAAGAAIVIGIPMGFGWLLTYPARKRKMEREAREASASEHTVKHTAATYTNAHGVR